MRFLVLLPIFALASCAVVKPIPQQTLNCFENQAAPAAAQAALCVAKGGGTAEVESCFLGAAEGQGLAVLECEGLAIWGDVQHANQVAAATVTPTTKVQANAQSYLVAKGVITPADMAHP